MKTKVKKAKGFVVNAIVKGIQGTCGVTHVGLRYAIDVVEVSEAKVLKRAYGQEADDTIKERRRRTNVVRLNNVKSYNAFRERVKELAKSKFGTSEEAVVETMEHGDMFV